MSGVGRWVMTTRIMLIPAVAIMIGPSLVYGSSACMTESEARAKFPKAHLYWHGSEHCWDDRPGYGSHADVRPALAPARVPSQPKIVGSGIDGGRVTGAQCRYAPCE
jgi:hypothetical protein